ncbi:cell division protein FtsZ [Halovenus sp. WSH3]|uniref:Tubulin-like protein CetZ n=1 Tax=Halovenus carboxidivorans TaxID=2692199 RepID=A0A6B0T5Z1_9EURY|nr:cell division protein FtsZ [Halovenus carboxidivorans]MXR50631.1 cell division protein FtsZ [Halovenus carboxidivorans]
MKFALVGVGGAGGRIVDALRKVEQNSDRAFSNEQTLLFDTTQSAFEAYDHVPADRHVLIGDTHPDIRGTGLDGDIELGAEVAEEDTDEIYREFDKLATHSVHATLLVAGLGGGTGGGVGPVILEGLQSITDNPVYVLGILPADIEGDQQAYNAARSLQSYVDLADNVILFDNEEWADDGGDLDAQYPQLNIELVTRIIAVLGVGELEDAPIAETMLDPSDTMKALDSGGVSSLGYATTELDRPDSLLGKLLAMLRSNDTEQEITDAAKIKDLIQATVDSKLTLPCSVDSAERAMLSLSGPPDVCSRKGFETGRYWLEKETDTVQIWAGDEPHDASLIAASVLLSNVTDVPRIDEIQRRAVAYKREHVEDSDASDELSAETVDPSETAEQQTDSPDDAATRAGEPADDDGEETPSPTPDGDSAEASGGGDTAKTTADGDSAEPSADGERAVGSDTESRVGTEERIQDSE